MLEFAENLMLYHQYAGKNSVLPGVNVNSRHLILLNSDEYFG